MIVLYYLIAAAVVALDQLTKWLAVDYLKPEGSVPLIDGVLHLTYVENEGAAFGMMKNSRWVFMIVSAVAIAVLLIVIARYGKRYKFATFAVSMILGGGIGNMIDRLRIGYVVDFVDFRLINFAVFNVADSFVTVGAALLVGYLVMELVREGKAEREKKTLAAGASADVTDAAESDISGVGSAGNGEDVSDGDAGGDDPDEADDDTNGENDNG